MQEGYQKGPLHVGRVQIAFRCYAWTDKEIQIYKDMRQQEDLYLLAVIDDSVRSAMEALGDELMRYLEEAGDEIPEDQKKLAKPKQEPIAKNVIAGFGEMFGFYRSKKLPKLRLPNKKEMRELEMIKSVEGEKVKGTMWGIYHHFKKHHGMLNW